VISRSGLPHHKVILALTEPLAPAPITGGLANNREAVATNAAAIGQCQMRLPSFSFSKLSKIPYVEAPTKGTTKDVPGYSAQRESAGEQDL